MCEWVWVCVSECVWVCERERHVHYTRPGSVLHITSYLFAAVCHIRNPRSRVCDRSHSS